MAKMRASRGVTDVRLLSLDQIDLSSTLISITLPDSTIRSFQGRSSEVYMDGVADKFITWQGRSKTGEQIHLVQHSGGVTGEITGGTYMYEIKKVDGAGHHAIVQLNAAVITAGSDDGDTIEQQGGK